MAVGKLTTVGKLTAEEVQIRARKRVLDITRMLETDDGKKLLENLEIEFDSRPLVRDSAHQTVIAAAQRDVIHWIKEIIRRGNDL